LELHRERHEGRALLGLDDVERQQDVAGDGLGRFPTSQPFAPGRPMPAWPPALT
jgi:hypothetical protein